MNNIAINDILSRRITLKRTNFLKIFNFTKARKATKKRNGFAIVLAWPETYCKQAGAWYDGLMELMRISNNNFYKVGHAALILIDKNNPTCQYFDFGRYHAPHGKGRVRSFETDNELIVKIKARISKNGKEIENINEITKALQSKDVYHGDGVLYASYVEIDFNKAIQKALSMQNKGAITYGPFRLKGTNCSRFVNTVTRAGKPKFLHSFKMFFLQPFTPTPKRNVIVLPNYLTEEKPEKKNISCPARKNENFLKSTMPQPAKHNAVPENAQWLSGEGYGSWFHVVQENSLLHVTRFSPKGNVECEGFFENKVNKNFKLEDTFKITHLSNCKQVTIIQKNQKYYFLKI